MKMKSRKELTLENKKLLEKVGALGEENGKLLQKADQLLERVDLLEEENSKLQLLVVEDTLTGLLNRRGFEERFKIVLEELAHNGSSDHRHHHPFDLATVIYMDVDNFKVINDTLGHHVGDEVLMRVSAIIRKHFRKMDLIARLGGDEIVVAALDHETDFVEKKMAEISEEIQALSFGNDLKIGLSFGTSNTAEYVEYKVLLNAAETRMRRAKKIKKASR